MSETDDIDERFTALTAQISERERRRMRRSAARERTRPQRFRRSLRTRRRWRRVAVATALVVAAGAFVTYRPDVVDRFRAGVFGGFSGSGRPDGGTGRAEAGLGAGASGTDTPFAGSPAAAYADGVKGLVMPRAKAMGGLSRKEVAAAVRRAKDMLVASHLNRAVLLGGRPKKLIRLLDPEQRGPFVKGLDHPSPKGDYHSRNWVTSLAPGSSELVGDVVKVHGRSGLSVFREDGLRGVRVKVNYLFVYAIRRPGRPETLTRLVVHSTGRLEAWKDERDRGELRFWVSRWNVGGSAPARCDVDDGFVHPFYPDSAPDTKVDVTAPPVDPYSLEEEGPQECSVLQSGT
ncbi:hypothetical protein ACLQ2R_10485 [Streptosporangium sp. DT93]|uniref:hypothetical protein n=1 Tax=Streptosporangium sp. DT93 TaxID=3393428 RepID=UPI003CF484B5